jgi:phage terminase large subunit
LAYRRLARRTRRTRALERALCAQDLEHWLCHWAWTFDPREPVSTLPFDPFPRQREFLRWLSARESAQEDGLVEKSRDMGVTWLCCAFALHRWLYRDGYKVGFGSRKLDLVDRLGDPDSIFEKLRFLYQNLPEWMLPTGFDPGEHDCEAKLLNPANGSAVTGEGGDNVGRGGRATVYFLDEAAFVEHPERVDRSLSQTTRVRVDLSTPNGAGNPFYRKRFSGTVPVFVFDWRDDPRKGDAWYAGQRRRLDPVTLAQEVDRDYTASVEGVTIPGAWVQAAVGLDLPPSAVPSVAGWDVAEEGSARNVLIPRRGPRAFAPLEWGRMNTTEGAWHAARECARLGVAALFYDCVGPGMGAKGTFAASEQRLPFTAVAVSGSASPTDAVWPDGRTSKEVFLNLRAELWWLLRCRFERAYEYRAQGVNHRPEDMVSIPAHPDLVAQLSLPLYSYTSTGKIRIESKEDMRRRGVKSPDFADALVYAFFPWRPPGRPAAYGGPAFAQAPPPAGVPRGLPNPFGGR